MFAVFLLQQVSQTDKGILAASLLTCERGMSSGQDPRLIDEKQAALLINTTVRGGFPHNRPGWAQIGLIYEDEEDQSAVENGRFQGVTFFQPRMGAPCLIASISGRQWRFNIWTDNTVQEITIGELNPRTVTTASYVQPVVGGTVNMEVADSTGAYIGQSIVVAGGGIYLVTAVPDGTHVTLQNTGTLSVKDATVVASGATVTPQTYDPNPSNKLQVWFVQAEDFLLMQDGSSKPWCYNGATARRLDLGELPTGCMMVYALGRVGVSLPDLLSFVFGDLVGSSSGTPGYAYRDAVLKFTENDFLNEGGAFAVPMNAGRITAMQYVPNLDTSLGQGPIEVFTENGAFSVNLPFDRTTWKNLTYPIQTVSLASPGSLSQWSTVRVNGDLWFRASDGIRSFIIARRDFGMWGNVPMSEEVTRLLRYDTPWMLPWASAVFFDNRMLMTATPQWDADHGVFHRALAVMDFDLISSLWNRTQPAWDGMWTGLEGNEEYLSNGGHGGILQLIKGFRNTIERCFAFTLTNGVIQLWENLPDSLYDQPFGSPAERIRWGFETRLFDYGSPNTLKSLERADLAPSSIQGEVSFSVQFRSDENPCWLDWNFGDGGNVFTICAQDSNCAPDDCWTPDIYNKTYRSRVSLPSPPLSCETPPNKPAQLGYRHQLRWTILGPCVIKQLVLYARDMQQSPFESFQGCTPDAVTCSSDTCCAPDNYFQSEV